MGRSSGTAKITVSTGVLRRAGENEGVILPKNVEVTYSGFKLSEKEGEFEFQITWDTVEKLPEERPGSTDPLTFGRCPTCRKGKSYCSGDHTEEKSCFDPQEAFLEEHNQLLGIPKNWRCPTCERPAHRVENGWIYCTNGHYSR